MKAINETLLQDVLAYVKKFQQEKGISPSYRNIANHLGIASISTAHKYIHTLESRGMLQMTNIGNIQIPLNLSKGKTQVAPLVGTVACGEPINAEQNIEETFQLPTSIFGSEQLIGLRAQGNSMTGVGIYNGDIVFYYPTNDADNGEIIVALIDNSATIKRLEKKKDYAILHPENPDYKDIITKELIIQGVVKHVVHSF